ncbi:type IV secretion system protein [Nocardioides marmotae]|uniref:type IV secretion system protein n=1 Tax=Nocardioides marmotae TaxID=2663857 RepID=UPI0012B599D0|nr:type IV secretion system protein [Nocardioides marmotae]MBC9735543.1 type IV secretion system protein [Nocardioides marmotae]MTB86640.1 hypothetical protein [Nocardioides marmotae]
MSSWIVPLIDLNPFSWLGEAASEGLADGFTSMMMALWSASLWLLTTVFKLLDRFTTPDVTDPGLRGLYGATLWISAVVALLIGLGQIGLAAIRRDGRPLGTLLAGVAQYAAALAGWIVVAAGVITSSAAVASGLLDQLVGVDAFAGFPAGAGWEVKASGVVESTVLGICGLFVLIPASFGYLVIMLVREAALLVLTATMPIAAAGALGEGTRRWMWTAVRWFLAACLTSPLLALVLGLGVRIGEASLATTATEDATSSIGMAVVGCVTMLVACVCPMALFRLLAFVDPGTASGATMRSSLAANGGISGLFGTQRASGGDPAAATQPAPDGRSSSESAADASTSGRFGGVLSSVPSAGVAVGSVIRQVAETGRRGAALSVDVLGQSGVGHQGYYDTSSPGPSAGRRPRHPATLPGGTGGKSSTVAAEGHAAEAAEAAEFLA